jgi:fido (protein-threonine AMPylation protein)
MAEQTKLFFWNNQNLFSNNYLERHLPITSLWKEQKEKIADVFNAVKKAHGEIKSLKLGPGEEAGLEDKFIRPVLKILGFEWDVQPTTKRGIKKKRPDYALFKDKTSFADARKEKDNLMRFFKYPITILEAKYWGRRLNDSDPKDTLDCRDPTAQTVKYLDDVYHASDGRIQWAILTNGKHWRLFYHKAASRSGNFFEVDLEEIITGNNSEKLLYFYLFFSRDSFVPDPVTDKTWLDQHLKGTEEYAARVSTKLKDLIFDKVFEGLAEGFVHYRTSELSVARETEETKKDIFKGCLTLLYRLLFLLYAESRNLFPVEEDGYHKVSLSRLKKDIYKDISTAGITKMSKRSYVYWTRLESLFDIIANGDSALNVPIYNGGLFEAPKDSFLSVHKMPDPFLAEAIELLTVDHEGEFGPDTVPFIDYSSLNVRHLGDIYEGLLEFHVQIADEEMVEVKEKGKSLWKKLSEITSGTKTSGKKARGDVYIENSKHERKATGSYYTPHYIVEYIVNNTVGPVLEEKLEAASNLLLEHEKASKALRKQKSTSGIQGYRIKIKEIEDRISDAIFGIKVLDPAMGSGHFLVHTVDVVSDRIVLFLADYPENPVIRKIHELRNEILAEIKQQGVRIDEGRLTEVNLIKRMVMKRCIYGVDLNDMAVELAKLSLWLDSFTLGTPLSFLDHHLKCGNSLIGTNIEELEKALTGHLFAINLEPLKRAIRDMIFVSDLPDATVEQVRESYKKFGEANRGLEGYRILLDMLVAEHFGIADTKKMLVSDFDKIDLNNLHVSISKLPDKDKKLIEKAEAITKEKKFFHWEIEFPEVFHEKTAEFGQKIDRMKNPGFDCVIGNPPYGVLNREIFFKKTFSFINSNWDIYVAFIERGVSLLKAARFVSYIAPVSWETSSMFEDMRKHILSKMSIRKIVNLPYDVFKDAYIDTGIFLMEKTESKSNKALVYEFPKKTKIVNMDNIEYQSIDQGIWNINKNQIVLNSNAISIISKLIRISTKLEDITVSIRGVLAASEFVSSTNKSDYYPFFEGEMFRYEISSPDKFIDYSAELQEKPADINFFKDSRIFVRRLINRQDRLMATCSKDFFITKKDIYIFKITDDNYSHYYVLSLLNSELLSFIYQSQETISKKDDFRQATLEGVRQLPIPRISFTTPEKERKKRVDEAIKLYQSEIKAIAINAGKWQNREKDSEDDKDRDKEGSAKARKVAGRPRRYKLPEEGVSGEGPGLGGEVHGIREGTGEYGPSEGAPGEGKDSTRPLDSTRFLETAQGIKTYSEVSEILAVAVAQTIDAIIQGNPKEVHVTSEWICKLHGDIAGSLFPGWAGRFRDLNVQVGRHTPPPYYEVPVHVRSYCEDLTARLLFAEEGKGIEKISETLAYADWRFQWIHPFRDFNGRVGRLLLTAILFKLKLPPAETVSIEPEGKKRYLQALRAADGGDLSLLKEVWTERLSKALEEKGER